MATVGEPVVLHVRGVGAVRGDLARVATGWCLVAQPTQDWVVRLEAVDAVEGASPRATPEVAWPVTGRLTVASALRRLAEAGERCVVHLVDGARHDGVPRRVGQDFVELVVGAEGHERLVLVALAAVAAVQSEEAEVSHVALHVGLPKTGTTWLQDLLTRHQQPLRAAGVQWPAAPGAMFRGAVEVRGSHEKFGLSSADVDSRWETICRAAHEFPGLTVLGHEVLGGATPEQVERALAPLRGLEVDVVVTARDLGRQAVAHWQEEVKLGDPRSFAEFERTELRADTGRDLGPDSGGVRPRFWHAQDAADALRRWSASCRPSGCTSWSARRPERRPPCCGSASPTACGVDPAVVDASAVPPANTSLGTPEIAVLREMNRLLARRRVPVDTRTRLRVLKREYAEGVLAARPSTPAAHPRVAARPAHRGDRRLGRGDPRRRVRRARRPGRPRPGHRRPRRASRPTCHHRPTSTPQPSWPGCCRSRRAGAGGAEPTGGVVRGPGRA